MRRYGLRDDQWDRIKDFLPGRDGHVGGTAADNRLFVEAVLFRFRCRGPLARSPWALRRLEDRPSTLQSMGEKRVFERVFKVLASDHGNEYMMIDATIVIVRAHQHSAGARKKVNDFNV
jgi:transposase